MIYNWNEFIFVNTFISSEKYKTLTVGVQNFVGQYTTDWGAIGATLMISILPIMIAFIPVKSGIFCICPVVCSQTLCPGCVTMG